MGTTLTGTTPQDTYDSLIKVTDNGPISGTAKYLSDGLGNDSALSLSTTALGIGTNNPTVTLTVVGPAGSPNVLSLSGANSNCDILMQSAGTSSATRLRNATNDFQIHTNGTEQMRITSAGELQLTGNGVVRNQHSSANYSYWQQSDVDARLFVQYAQPLIFGTNASERMRITSAGNVGIGTTNTNRSGLGIDHIVLTLGKDSEMGMLEIQGTRTSDAELGRIAWLNAGTRLSEIVVARIDNDTSTKMLFSTSNAGSLSTRMTIAKDGNVGIGTSGPTAKLSVNAGAVGVLTNFTDGIAETLQVITGSGYVSFVNPNSGVITFRDSTNAVERVRIQAGGGISFNGDTAAANALDDYEEGTWTMGVSFGGAAVGVTYGANAGTYTKIGRQVTVNGYLALSSKGSSTGAMLLTGLPFTIGNSNGNYSSGSIFLNVITFANQFQISGQINTTTIELVEITEAGVQTALTNADFANNSTAIIGFTYFV
jgi:hypothetical protein